MTPITLTRPQFEALAYGWNLFTSTTNADMLQLVEMGYLHKPQSGLLGAACFERTEAGKALGSRMLRDEIVVTIAAKETP